MKSLYRICVAMTALLPLSAWAADLSDSDRDSLVRAAHTEKSVVMLHSMKEFPESVVEAWRTCHPRTDNRIADPNEDFETTDSLSGKNLPYRRLIWGAHISHFYVLHFQKGGHATMFPFLVFSDQQSPLAASIVLTGANLKGPLKDYDAFATKLRNSALHGVSCSGM